MPRSTKLFKLEFYDGNLLMKVPLPTASTKFVPEKHFRDLEESDFIVDRLGGIPYITYSTDSTEGMNNLMQNGYTDGMAVQWRPFFAYWKDQEGHAWLTPIGSGIKDLRDLGIITKMKSPADFMKVAKYANRTFAPLPKETAVIDQETGKVAFTGGSKWGKEVGWSEEFQVAAIELMPEPGSDISPTDRIISVRYMDLNKLDVDPEINVEKKALVDGFIAVSERGARSLGLSNDPKLGDVWRGTYLTTRGLGKGHIELIPNLKVDVVIYGPKTIIKSVAMPNSQSNSPQSADFWFGSMGPLHAGIPHTDMQAYVNFGYHRPGLGGQIARQFMREVLDASTNEPAARQLFLKHSKDAKELDLDTEQWILRRGMAYGVSFLRFPGLFRRNCRYLMKKVMACDANARIPMSSTTYSVAEYGYVLPTPTAITEDGDVNLETCDVPEGHIVFPDLKPGTKVVCYRQPSENSNAWVPMTITYKPEYKRFAGRGVCLLGRGAHKVLGRLGGGDMDDSFVIVHDPKWVESFHTLRTYPETEKITADVSDEDESLFKSKLSELDLFEEEIQEAGETYYSNRHVAWQIELAKNQRAGIGPVVNYGMMDMLMSDPDHRASMLADLKNTPEFWEWLDQREPYQAAKFMTNLELVIDGNVKDRTLLAKLGDVSGTIKKFHKECLVYPASMSPWRVPDSKIARGDYKTARSLLCRSLEEIRLLRERLEEIFIEREWDIVTPATNDLDGDYPFEKEIKARVRGTYRKDRDTGEWVRKDPENVTLLDIWGQEWREALSIPNNPEVSSGRAYKRIINLLAEEVRGESDDMMERIAVQLYREIYRSYGTQPKIDENTGKMRNYQDGLLWSPLFGNHFINACRKARVTGLYKAAVIRPEFIGRVMDKSIMVQVRNKMVYTLDSQDQFTVMVGYFQGSSWNGTFRMDSGLVEFRKSQPMLQPDDERMITPRPLVRIFPSTVKPAAEEAQAVKVPGTLGQILNKALNVLGIKPEDKK